MEWTATLVIGAAVLAGAIGAYLRRPDQWIFPVVLALVGVVLCGANAVKATLGDGTTIEINRPLLESADANYKQIAAQQVAIDTLAQGLSGVQTALSTLTEAVRKQAAAVAAQQVASNEQAAAGGTAPVPPTSLAATSAAVSAADETEAQLATVRANNADLRQVLVRSRDAGNAAMVANRRLRSLAERP